jgi:DNA-binding NarL/FixJ family response regulator
MDKIKVLIADDHPVFRKGLYGLLKETKTLECVGLAKDGEEAISLSQELKPDVVLVDVDMPKMTGIETAGRIKLSCPKTAVLILSAFNYDYYIIGCIQAGADGYLLKSMPPRELIKAIQNAYSGKRIFDLEATHRILCQLLTNGQPVQMQADKLHSREIEVLRLVAKGMTNRQIALQLSISDHTVGTHLANTFRKLGVGSRMEAVNYAIQRGIITREHPCGSGNKISEA